MKYIIYDHNWDDYVGKLITNQEIFDYHSSSNITYAVEFTLSKARALVAFMNYR